MARNSFITGVTPAVPQRRTLGSWALRRGMSKMYGAATTPPKMVSLKSLLKPGK